MNKSFRKMINRKNFFSKAAAGFLGFMLVKSFPFSLLGTSKKEFVHKVKVKINPSAVSRKK